MGSTLVLCGDLTNYGKTPEVFAGILTIGIIGLVSDQLIRLLHRRAFRYLG